MIKTVTVHLGNGGIIKCKHISISIERRRDIPGFFLLNQGDCLFVSVDLENRDPPMIFYHILVSCTFCVD